MAYPRSVADQTGEFRQAFQLHLPERIRAIEENWHGLLYGAWDRYKLGVVFKRVQELAGAAGKFGLVKVSEGAFSLELILQQLLDEDRPSSKQIDEVNSCLTELKARTKISQEPGLGDGIWPEDKRSRIFYLRPDETMAPDLVTALEILNFKVIRFQSTDSLLAKLTEESPAALILDARMLPGGKLVVEKLAALKASKGSAPAVILISPSSDVETRLVAMRAGADAFFGIPIDVAEVAARVRQLASSGGGGPFRIMVVDDDPQQADFAAAILRKADMEPCSVTEPMQVLDTLDAFRPDLILMDLYMPGADGIELTSIIREQSEFVGIPIVFLSGEQDTDKQLNALSVGGDDFIAKPIRPRQLISIIKNRVQRARALQAQSLGRSQRDPLTGLFHRRHFFERLDHVLVTGGLQPAARGVLYISLDRRDTILQEFGPAATEALLAELGVLIAAYAEIQDITTRISEDGFGLLAKRPADRNLIQLAESLVQNISQSRFHLEQLRFQPTVSIGVCVIDAGLTDAAGIMSRAAKACADAKTHGGSQIRVFQQQAPQTQSSDQDIPRRNLADLVRDALRMDGFQVLYQPFVNLSDKGTENYEVMLRLKTEDGDQVTAPEFQPEARQAGLMMQIDRWVLSHALAVLDNRRKAGNQLQLLIPQSVETLADGKVADWLRDQLRRRLLVGTGLILEFNLVDMAVDLKRGRELIGALRDMGVATSLARFGHNESSYKVLNYLAPQYVKVVDKLMQADHQVVADLVRRAHELGVRVIIPRVDDPRQIAEQWLSGADFVQGNAIQGPRDQLDYDFSGHFSR